MHFIHIFLSMPCETSYRQQTFCKKTPNLSRGTQILFGYLCFAVFPFSSHFPPFYLLPPLSIWFCFFFSLPYLLFSWPTDIYLFLLAPLSKWWKNSSKVLLLCWLVSSPIARSAPDDLNTFFYNQEVFKVELDCTHTFGHCQLSLSTSVHTKVPRDAYTL